MKKLFLLDGMALIYRAHFALSKTPRFTAAGINTSAIMGFTNTLLEVLKKENPSHIAVVFDTAVPTTRHIEFEAYKAHREAMPEDLSAAIPYIYQLIKGFNIPVITYDGFEADDIIGTLAKKAEAEGFMVYCMTPDKDFAQLVSENILLYRPARMGNGAEVHGVKEVLEKWEIERVEQVIDILGLWGDAVDNIPGIPGIGEKTAKKLIQEYGSVEEIIKHSHELKGKQRENIENFAEQGIISKKLATILLDVPIDFDEASLRLEEPDKELLEPLFAELEFRTLGKRVFGEGFNVNESKLQEGTQIDLFSQPQSAGNLNKAEYVAPQAGKNIDNTEHDYRIAQTAEEINELVHFLSQQKAICFDTETTGIDANCCDLVGLSFSVEVGKAWYVPLSENREECLSVLNLFKPIYENEEIEKIGQNLKYDILILSWYDIEVKGKLFDTMLAHYLIDADSRHNMDVLAENYLGYSTIPISKLIGAKGKKQGNMRDVPIEDAAPYASEDADITLQLKEVFMPVLEEIGALSLANEVEFPLIYVLAAMEREGVCLDISVLKEISRVITIEIFEHEGQIHEKAGVKFNIASPKQLGEVLFDKLQLDPKAKKTKTGQYQTGEDVLLALASKSDIVQDILNFRQLQKLKSTYLDALPELLNIKSARIHTSFNQAVASTGRLSSTNPNLQNIPIKTERGREVRKAFVARDDNHVIMAADYSQIELRIVAEISGDKAMREAFIEGVDIHTATAAKVYGVSLDEVTSAMRRNAKAVNFGIIYGQSAFGLSQNLGIPRREAADMIEQYFIQYPGIKAYMNDTINFAREHGYVETLLKRRRYLRDINSQNATVRGFAERNGINAPIQGSAADMIKVAMIGIHNDIKEQGLKGRMTMQVHDELVFDVPKDEIEIFKQIVESRMKNAIKMEVPIVVEIGIGKNWLEAH
ncbi:DNA polymerase I [Albibacterium bauzanense]|uniref:DNA polymerase I n=1 Tax=Albibacterium bauzanense TaxID=653929 RepID=A0A4R1LWB2_9SPHI|nr:DNA polymerase I [Albibacterium bauzanense]TCK83077.1 DNA polymerase I [Albibacterium bauzanense]